MFELPSTQEKLPQKIFGESCKRRLDELVEEGVFNTEFAADRIENASLIESGLTEPEKQGIEFAEIGMNEFKQFNERVDTAVETVSQQVEAANDQLNEIISSFEEVGIPDSNINNIRQTIQDIRIQLEGLKQKAEKIKGGGVV